MKTSAEQEAVKKKERAEKVRVYKEVTSKIYDKVFIKCSNIFFSKVEMD